MRSAAAGPSFQHNATQKNNIRWKKPFGSRLWLHHYRALSPSPPLRFKAADKSESCSARRLKLTYTLVCCIEAGRPMRVDHMSQPAEKQAKPLASPLWSVSGRSENRPATHTHTHTARTYVRDAILPDPATSGGRAQFINSEYRELLHAVFKC